MMLIIITSNVALKWILNSKILMIIKENKNQLEACLL